MRGVFTGNIWLVLLLAVGLAATRPVCATGDGTGDGGTTSESGVTGDADAALPPSGVPEGDQGSGNTGATTIGTDASDDGTVVDPSVPPRDPGAGAGAQRPNLETLRTLLRSRIDGDGSADNPGISDPLLKQFLSEVLTQTGGNPRQELAEMISRVQAILNAIEKATPAAEGRATDLEAVARAIQPQAPQLARLLRNKQGTDTNKQNVARHFIDDLKKAQAVLAPAIRPWRVALGMPADDPDTSQPGSGPRRDYAGGGPSSPNAGGPSDLAGGGPGGPSGPSGAPDDDKESGHGDKPKRDPLQDEVSRLQKRREILAAQGLNPDGTPIPGGAAAQRLGGAGGGGGGGGSPGGGSGGGGSSGGGTSGGDRQLGVGGVVAALTGQLSIPESPPSYGSEALQNASTATIPQPPPDEYDENGNKKQPTIPRGAVTADLSVSAPASPRSYAPPLVRDFFRRLGIGVAAFFNGGKSPGSLISSGGEGAAAAAGAKPGGGGGGNPMIKGGAPGASGGGEAGGPDFASVGNEGAGGGGGPGRRIASIDGAGAGGSGGGDDDPAKKQIPNDPLPLDGDTMARAMGLAANGIVTGRPLNVAKGVSVIAYARGGFLNLLCGPKQKTPAPFAPHCPPPSR